MCATIIKVLYAMWKKKMLNDTQLFTFIWIKGRLIFNLRKVSHTTLNC